MTDWVWEDEEGEDHEDESPLRFDPDTGQFWSALQDDYCLPAPSHSPELERLQYLHEAYKWAVGNATSNIASFLGDNACKILDVGTGTGVWAVEMAQDYPNCRVFGVDLVDVPVPVPPANCTFLLEDVMLGLPYRDDYFDFVHVRDLSLGFRDYNAMLQECIRVLKPGGYILIRESEYDVKEENDQEEEFFPEMQRFFNVFREALVERGLDPWVGHNLEERVYQLYDVVDIDAEKQWVPFGSWAEDSDLHEAGAAAYNAFMLFPESTTIMMLDHGERETYQIGANAKAELEHDWDDEPFWYFHSVEARKAGMYEAPGESDDEDEDGGSPETEGSDDTA